MRRSILGAILAPFVAGAFYAGPVAQAAPVGADTTSRATRATSCTVDAEVPRLLLGPRRLRALGTTACTDGAYIANVTVWTSLQWFNGDLWQTIATNKVSRSDVPSGTAIHTAVTRSCEGGSEHFIFRTKVQVWVRNANGDVILHKTDIAPQYRGVLRYCGTTAGF